MQCLFANLNCIEIYINKNILKVSKYQISFLAIVLILSFLIALPTINMKIGDNELNIRGLNVDDIKKDTQIQDFQFASSLDINGGQVVTYTADLSGIAEENRDAVFNEIKSIINFRISKMNVGDYELSTFVDKETPAYKVVLKAPQSLKEEQLTQLDSRGEISFWIEQAEQIAFDENGEPIDEKKNKKKDPLEGTAYESRVITDLNNLDIISAHVISDSRVFLTSAFLESIPDQSILPENSGQIRTYGVSVTYNSSSNIALFTALSANPLGTSPMLVSIDGEPVAYQASGQDLSTFTLDKENTVLFYTLTNDTSRDNQVLAALLSSPSIDYPVELTSVEVISPILGNHISNNIKVGLGLSFVLSQALLFYYFKKSRGRFVILTNTIYLVTTIALLKVFGTISNANIPLSFALVAGVIMAIASFMAFTALMTYRIRTKSQGGLLKDEVVDEYIRTRDEYRNFVIAFVLIAFVIQSYGTLPLDQFANGLGFGVISGLFSFLFIVKSLAVNILLKKA